MSTTQPSVTGYASHKASPGRPTTVRYRVLGLTFLMAFMMYMERGAIGAAAPSIMREFHVDKVTMGWGISAFNWSYAIFQIPGGWMADRFGARIVLAAAMMWWSVFTAATGATFNIASLACTRFLFGIGEAAAFPSGSRALVKWLPPARRAFGQGFQHSGSRLGAAVAPALVILLIGWSGWRVVFVSFGAIGVLWAIAWFGYYRNVPREHSGVNEEEADLIADGRAARSGTKTSIPWKCILTSRDVLLLSFAYFCYGWVLWLYLAWLPTYLREVRHFSMLSSGLAGVPLLAATLTNILGGVFSDSLTARWQNVRKGRVGVSLVGFLIAGSLLIPSVKAASPALSLAALTIALAGLELTVAPAWAMTIDLGGDCSGSVSSVMNTCGNIGGALSAVAIGYLATHFGWTTPFLVASAFCFVSAALVSQIRPERSVVAA